MFAAWSLFQSLHAGSEPLLLLTLSAAHAVLWCTCNHLLHLHYVNTSLHTYPQWPPGAAGIIPPAQTECLSTRYCFHYWSSPTVLPFGGSTVHIPWLFHVVGAWDSWLFSDWHAGGSPWPGLSQRKKWKRILCDKHDIEVTFLTACKPPYFPPPPYPHQIFLKTHNKGVAETASGDAGRFNFFIPYYIHISTECLCHLCIFANSITNKSCCRLRVLICFCVRLIAVGRFSYPTVTRPVLRSCSNPAPLRSSFTKAQLSLNPTSLDKTLFFKSKIFFFLLLCSFIVISASC